MSFDLALVDSDLSLKPDGKIRTVENTEKLKQDIIKIILTPIGSVKFHPWYGSAIGDVIGNVLPDNILFEEIRSSVQASMEHLQTLQRAQSTTQSVSLSEIIRTIDEIAVERTYYDLRQIQTVVSITSRDLTRIAEEFSIQ